MNIINYAHAAADRDYNIFKLSFYNYNGDLVELANVIINWLLLLAGIIAFFYLIYSGFLYITAAGNPDAAKKGQQGVLNAIIGIVVVIFSYAIVIAVNRFIEGKF